MEIRRFGPGHRRPDGPPGTQGIAGQGIWSDERAHISELAFSRRALVAPHANPNTALFIVVSGGGWVRVGEEQVRVNHGEAVVWPADVVHGAWTDGSEMRAIVVELPEGSAGTGGEGSGSAVPGADGAATSPAASLAVGALAQAPAHPRDHDESEGEPW